MHIKIDDTAADQRFDRFLRKYFKPYGEITLTDIFSRIRKGAIKVNQRKQKEKYRLQLGDVVSRDDSITTNVKGSDAKRTKKERIVNFPVQDAKDMLIFEDDNRLIFNKPPRLVMHPGAKHGHDMSLHDIMKSYLKQTDQILTSETFHPSFCFRLDKDTSGIVIAAKTYQALQSLNEQIRERKTSKKYIAVVRGKFNKQLTIDAPLFKGFDRASGKAKMFINHEKGVEAITTATNLETYSHPELGTISRVEVQLYTGRMHQIRIHMAHAGFPLIGDTTYGHAPTNRIATKQCHITRQLLHSRTYGFFDPFLDKGVSFTSPIPQEFTDVFM